MDNKEKIMTRNEAVGALEILKDWLNLCPGSASESQKKGAGKIMSEAIYALESEERIDLKLVE